MTAKKQGRRDDALGIWKAGVAAVEAGGLVRKALRVRRGVLSAGDLRLPLAEVRRIVVVGAGKAGAAMAAAVEDVLGAKVLAAKEVQGWVNVPDGTVRSLGAVTLHGARAGAENRPTAAGVHGVMRIRKMVDGLGRDDLVLCLISGGGSALLPAPANGITLSNKLAVTRLLHRSGGTIEEMNAVRKHLSALKGGRLARAAAPARLLSLIVSDVVGDPLDAVASGPTVADPTTYADALAVLERYALMDRAPESVVRYLRDGTAGRRPETAKRIGSRVTNLVIGNNETALVAAAREARARGYRVVNLGSRMEGEARELGVTLAGIARGIREQGLPAPAPACVLCGGETTVSLHDAPSSQRVGGKPSPGKGGRNQELVLGALVHLAAGQMKDPFGGRAGGEVVIASGGTDGEDGPTDAAGAVADARVWRAARRKGLDAADHLLRHDAYPFFDAAGGLIRTGPTHTNVMDLQVVLVGTPRES